MRSRLEVTRSQRVALIVAAFALLAWGAGGSHVRLFAAVIGFLLILYAAGGGRVPWKIKFKDYVLYIAIGLVLVTAMVIYTLYLIRFG